MKITINTEVLKKESLSLSEFLILLIGYYNTDYERCIETLKQKGIVEPNLFSKLSIILSDNTKNLVSKILTESDDKAFNSGIDFINIAKKLQDLYPKGIKPGTTYYWRGTTEEIAQKLRVLVVKHNFYFTEEEAIKAVKEYIDSFNNFKYMQLLKYFILRTTDDNQGHKEMDSLFMTIIENNR